MKCKSPAFLPSISYCFSERQMSCPGLELKIQAQVWLPKVTIPANSSPWKARFPIKEKERNLILPAKVQTVLCVRARARRLAGGLGGSREEAGRCSTFLELSELNGVRNSALGAARRRLLFEPAAWRGRSGARHCSPPTHPGVSPAAGDRQREERTREPAGRPSDQQSALLWKRRMARRGHQRNKKPEGEKSLHEVQVKTEVTV